MQVRRKKNLVLLRQSLLDPVHYKFFGSLRTATDGDIRIRSSRAIKAGPFFCAHAPKPNFEFPAFTVRLLQ